MLICSSYDKTEQKPAVMNDSTNKINTIDITSAARKALIAANPDYYSFSNEQQECFRESMNEISRKKVKRILLKDLLNKKCSMENIDEAWDNVPFSKLLILNWASLLTKGIGEDFIYLNEIMAGDTSLLNFNTLYDLDHDDYLYQEKSRKESSPQYKGVEYYAYKFPPWIRLLINNQFYYATISSVATQLIDDIETIGDDYIDQLIPHTYSEGKDNGKSDSAGVIWDMVVNAEGQEAQLDELKSRWYNYKEERWFKLSKMYKTQPPAAYSRDIHLDDDPNKLFLFNNEFALKNIRWKCFLSDMKPMLANYSDLDKQLEQEIGRCKNFIYENHQDIQKNFDPKVVKLRKKRKIIVMPEAMSDLFNLDDEFSE